VAGNLAEARTLAAEARDLDRRLGFSSGEAQVVGLFAELEWLEGRQEPAVELVRDAIALAQESGFKWWEANMLGGLVEWLIELDRVDEAEAAGRQELELRLVMDDRNSLSYTLSLWAILAAKRGENELAGRIWGSLEAEVARRPVGHWSHTVAFATPFLPQGDPDYEAGRAAGARLALEDVVELVEAGDA
jgi:hypothetical protein